MPRELDELINDFEQWVPFAERLQQELPEETWNERLGEGKWTVKDVVNHMMLWDKYFYEEAIDKVVTDRAVTLKHLNYDQFNQEAIRLCKTTTIVELIDKTVYYRTKIITSIGLLAEEVVNQNYLDADGRVFYIPQYLEDFIWHDQHHIGQLTRFMNTGGQ